MNHRDRFLFSVVLVAGLAITNSLDAQVSFETAYGNGVHHYFGGEYQKAVDSLSLAIAEDQRDPRAYYYRGLANEALGNSSEKDFQTGAQMEVVRGGRLSLVNDALERVQGLTRITIEDTRRNALLTARNSRFSEPAVARPFPVAKDEVKTVARSAAPKKEPSPATAAPGQDVMPAAKIMTPPIKMREPAKDEAVEMKEGPKPVEDAPLKEVGFDEVVPADNKDKSPVDPIFGDDEPMEKEDAPKVDSGSPFEAAEEPKKEEAATDESVSPFEEAADDDDAKESAGEPVPSEDADPDDPFDL